MSGRVSVVSRVLAGDSVFEPCFATATAIFGDVRRAVALETAATTAAPAAAALRAVGATPGPGLAALELGRLSSPMAEALAGRLSVPAAAEVLRRHNAALRRLHAAASAISVPRDLGAMRNTPLANPSATVHEAELAEWMEQRAPVASQPHPQRLPLPALMGFIESLARYRAGVAVADKQIDTLRPFHSSAGVRSRAEEACFSHLALWLSHNRRALAEWRAAADAHGLNPNAAQLSLAAASAALETVVDGVGRDGGYALATALRLPLKRVLALDGDGDSLVMAEEVARGLVEAKVVKRQGLHLRTATGGLEIASNVDLIIRAEAVPPPVVSPLLADADLESRGYGAVLSPRQPLPTGVSAVLPAPFEGRALRALRQTGGHLAVIAADVADVMRDPEAAAARGPRRRAQRQDGKEMEEGADASDHTAASLERAFPHFGAVRRAAAEARSPATVSLESHAVAELGRFPWEWAQTASADAAGRRRLLGIGAPVDEDPLRGPTPLERRSDAPSGTEASAAICDPFCFATPGARGLDFGGHVAVAAAVVYAHAAHRFSVLRLVPDAIAATGMPSRLAAAPAATGSAGATAFTAAAQAATGPPRLVGSAFAVTDPDLYDPVTAAVRGKVVAPGAQQDGLHWRDSFEFNNYLPKDGPRNRGHWAETAADASFDYAMPWASSTSAAGRPEELLAAPETREAANRSIAAAQKRRLLDAALETAGGDWHHPEVVKALRWVPLAASDGVTPVKPNAGRSLVTAVAAPPDRDGSAELRAAQSRLEDHTTPRDVRSEVLGTGGRRGEVRGSAEPLTGIDSLRQQPLFAAMFSSTRRAERRRRNQKMALRSAAAVERYIDDKVLPSAAAKLQLLNELNRLGPGPR